VFVIASYGDRGIIILLCNPSRRRHTPRGIARRGWLTEYRIWVPLYTGHQAPIGCFTFYSQKIIFYTADMVIGARGH